MLFGIVFCYRAAQKKTAVDVSEMPAPFRHEKHVALLAGRYRMTDHFKGKSPHVKKLFQEFRALVRTFGRATVYAQKTRIVFQTRARFAGVQVRKNRLDIGLWLKRQARASQALPD